MIEGLITTSHVLLRAPLIMRNFGIRTWLSCCLAILSGRRTTFLELVWAVAIEANT